MGFLDNAKDKLSDAVDKHGDKIESGLDKAAALADDKTGNKHTDKLETGVAKAKDALDSLDGKNDDLGKTTPRWPPPTRRSRPVGRCGRTPRTARWSPAVTPTATPDPTRTRRSAPAVLTARTAARAAARTPR